MSSIYHFKQASWQRCDIEDKTVTNEWSCNRFQHPDLQLLIFSSQLPTFSNTNMLLSIFVNTANSFLSFLALFPPQDRVINRVFHLARVLSMASETVLY